MTVITVRKEPLTGTWFMRCRCGKRWSNYEWTNVIKAASLHALDHKDNPSSSYKWLLNEVDKRFIRQSILSSIKVIEDRAKIVDYEYSPEELDMLDSVKKIYDNPDAWVTIV